MKPFTFIKLIIFLAALVLATPFSASAAKGGIPGPPSGGGGGETETAGNNLSFPAIFQEAAGNLAEWDVADGTLGVTYSYGCDKPETTDSFEYPNTSCVDADGTFLTAEECTDAGAPCNGENTVDRIYWQKIADNYWQAESLGPLTPDTAAYLDWGDNLESVSWSASSVIRVETTPFASVSPTLQGFQMWHVSGQGTNEQWGVRASDVSSPVPYVYDSPYAIINTSHARLNLAKLEQGNRLCPDEEGGVRPDDNFFSRSWEGEKWSPSCTLRDIPYTAELNVGGKYVYGYNWMLRRDEMPSECGSGWDKAGWWRLTFYSDNDGVVFDENTVTTPPPTVPAEPTTFITLLEESDTGPLYTPVIDYSDNLTYIDICIKGSKGGGGGNGHKGGR